MLGVRREICVHCGVFCIKLCHMFVLVSVLLKLQHVLLIVKGNLMQKTSTLGM